MNSSKNATANNSDLVLLVVVCSAMSNFQERKTIRESWALDQVNLPQTKVIFLLGTIGNSGHKNLRLFNPRLDDNLDNS